MEHNLLVINKIEKYRVIENIIIIENILKINILYMQFNFDQFMNELMDEKKSFSIEQSNTDTDTQTETSTKTTEESRPKT